jgi:uncharacterized protein YdeI (YjbR/CyaY-like superfamily)
VELYKDIITYAPKNAQDWYNWLAKNGGKETCVWLILYNKDSAKYNLTWSEAVDEALCHGWIDSVANKRDGESRYQYFTPRKPKSNWSAINKDKIERLMKAKKMAPAGLAMVDLAKKTGTWTALEKVDALELPNEMKQLFSKNKIAFTNWEAFPKSVKKGILEWIYAAKKEETKMARITDTVEKAALNERANSWKK